MRNTEKVVSRHLFVEKALERPIVGYRAEPAIDKMTSEVV